MAQLVRLPVACPICGTTFTPVYRNQVYCSKECAHGGALLRYKEARERAREEARLKKAQGPPIKVAPVSKKNMWDAIIKGMEETGLSYGEYIARLDGFK